MIALRPATLDTVRPLRLRALREDADAFGSTLAREQGRPDADWDFWVRDSLIAFDGDTPVGMANLKVDGDEAQLFGMWVAPEARGRGVAEVARARPHRARRWTICSITTLRAPRRARWHDGSTSALASVDPRSIDLAAPGDARTSGDSPSRIRRRAPSRRARSR